jgi:hypothetical protein
VQDVAQRRGAGSGWARRGRVDVREDVHLATAMGRLRVVAGRGPVAAATGWSLMLRPGAADGGASDVGMRRALWGSRGTGNSVEQSFSRSAIGNGQREEEKEAEAEAEVGQGRAVFVARR